MCIEKNVDHVLKMLILYLKNIKCVLKMYNVYRKNKHKKYKFLEKY